MIIGENGIPGFPAHPHRGFETITIITEGTVDHSDSLGAQGRFGGGSDTQWVTTGAGLQHAEMFPLVNSGDKGNPMELFQIWMNLPAKHKMCKPHFSMLWTEKNPVITGDGFKIAVIADEAKALTTHAQSPPPESWASEPGSDVCIALIYLEPNGAWTLPACTSSQTKRNIYLFQGDGVRIGQESPLLANLHGAELEPTHTVTLSNTGTTQARLLLLQGRPIGEPVAQQGPFVLNTAQELAQAFSDYRRTQFGGWPWKTADPVCPRATKRFARHPDGREEFPDEWKKDDL